MNYMTHDIVLIVASFVGACVGSYVGAFIGNPRGNLRGNLREKGNIVEGTMRENDSSKDLEDDEVDKT